LRGSAEARGREETRRFREGREDVVLWREGGISWLGVARFRDCRSTVSRKAIAASCYRQQIERLNGGERGGRRDW